MKVGGGHVEKGSVGDERELNFIKLNSEGNERKLKFIKMYNVKTSYPNVQKEIKHIYGNK